MARKFLTNIDLNTNELQNAVIQNLSSAPSSGNVEGRLYFDSTTKALRVYRQGADGLTWYDIAVGGTAANTVTLVGDVTGSANVDPTTGIITIDTHFNVSGTDNQIVVQDIDNVTTISLPQLVVIDNGEIHIQKTEYWRNGRQQGIIAAQSDGSLRLTGVDNGLQLESNSGNVEINPSTGLTLFNGGAGEAQLQKTSYWRNGTQQGVIAAQSDSSLRLTAISGNLELESNSGNVNINPSSGDVYFNNNIVIHSDGVISTQDTDITFNPDSGRINVDAHRTIFGGGGIDAFVRFQDSNGNDVVKITSGLASDELYHGYNSYTNTKVIDLNGFIKLSSENNDATGYLFVNAETAANSAAPTLHLESKGDLALRAGAHGNEGNIILYTGETSSGQPGKVYIGWGNARAPFNLNNEVATIGTYQTFSNKTLQAPIIDGPIGIRSSGGANGATIDVDSNTGTTTITGNNGDVNIVSDNNVNINAGTSTFHGNVAITGDLNVQGTLTAINKQEIDISDNTIVLNSNFTTGTPSQDAAITVKRGSANDVSVVWSESNKDWTITNDGNHYFGIARKFSANVGDASNTAFDIVHNLGTRDVTVQVYTNSSTYDVVETDIQMKDNNTVTVGFTVAPALNAYRVVIVG